jgi:type IV secretory pathway protease TraF
MIRAKFVLTGVALVFAGGVSATQQTVESQAVLIRDAKDQLVVTRVLGLAGDAVAVTEGFVVVNGRRTEVRVQPNGNWGPQVVEPGTYFVASDVLDIGTDPRGWGLIPADRIIGTVRIGERPKR